MKLRLLGVALFLLGIVCLAQQSSAQLGMTGVGGGFGGAAPLPTWGNTSSASNAACGFVTTCTVTTTAAVTSGVVAAGVYMQNSSGSGGGSFTAMSVCGTPLTPVPGGSTTGAAGGYSIAEFSGTVTGGASCSITVTYSITNDIQNVDVIWGTLNNLTSGTPGTACTGQVTVFSAPPFACSSGITVSAGGFGIAVFGASNSTTPTSSTVTVDTSVISGTLVLGIGHTTASNTPSFGGANASFADIAAAPWR